MQNEVPDSTSLSQEKKVETDTPRSAASSWKEALEKAMEAASHNQMSGLFHEAGAKEPYSSQMFLSG
jgi:hypothetical protein